MGNPVIVDASFLVALWRKNDQNHPWAPAVLGTLITEALLGGEISTGQTIRLEATGGQIQIHKSSSP